MSVPGFIILALVAALWIVATKWLGAWKRMRLRKRLHRRDGTVYLIRYGRNSNAAVHKVGFTCDWNRRSGELRRAFNGGDKEVTVIALWRNIPMAEAIEREFHASRFARKRKFRGGRDNQWARKLGVEDYWLDTPERVLMVDREISRRLNCLRNDAKGILCGNRWPHGVDKNVIIRRYSPDGSFTETRPFGNAS